MSIKIKKLESNITLLTNKFHSKTLSMGMWLDVGSVNEKANQFGIAQAWCKCFTRYCFTSDEKSDSKIQLI